VRDSFDRKIDYLRISITDRCNLRCRYCMPEAGVVSIGHDAILSYEELYRVARIAVERGVRKIRLTGGEPLVRRGVVDFIAALVALPEKPELTLTTNGVLLADYAEQLRQAGLARINVSLDSLQPERFQQISRRDKLQAVLDGLQAAEAAGLAPIKINMVPIRGVNEDEIAAFARLSYEHRWEIRFIEFMPVSAGLDYSDQQLYPATQIKQDLQRVAPLICEQPKGILGPARIYRLQGAIGTVGIIHAVSSHFCRECNRLRLTADGQLRPCLLSDHEIDLRSILRSTSDDEKVADVLLRSVAEKPERHCLGANYQPGQRKMQGIGG